LASKPVATVSGSLASKPAATVLQFGLKTGGDDFSRFGLKTGVGFLVEPQNHGGGGFPGLCLKTSGYGLVIWASKLP
jgi:hypothetical protein